MPLNTSKQDTEHVTALPKNILGSNGGIVSSAAETENWRVPIQLTVNGVEHAATVEPRTLLVYFLRDDLSLTGSHVGCDTSQYGA